MWVPWLDPDCIKDEYREQFLAMIRRQADLMYLCGPGPTSLEFWTMPEAVKLIYADAREDYLRERMLAHAAATGAAAQDPELTGAVIGDYDDQKLERDVLRRRTAQSLRGGGK